ncbi:MAG: ATP-binding protein [Planctomycetota bacterium]
MAEGWEGIRVTVVSDPRYLSPIRAVVREAAEIVGLSEEEGTELQLAVQEGCANVIRHCYRSRPDRRIDLEFNFTGDALVIRIDDYGRFVDPSCIQGRDLEDVRPGGLGVHFMKKIMDEVTYRRNGWGGTTLTMVKRLRRSGAEGERAGAGS